MDHNIQPTAPEAGTQILLPRTSVKSVCCIIVFLVLGTWEGSGSALESVFRIFMNFFAMRKRFPNGRKLLSQSYPQSITRKRSWRLLSIRSIQANCAWRRVGCTWLAVLPLHLVKLLQQSQ